MTGLSDAPPGASPQAQGAPPDGDAAAAIDESQLQRLFAQALSEDAGIRLLPRFKPHPTSEGEAYKVYAAASCACGTAAVLSVEVERSKTRAEVERAMPSLADQLRLRERAFRNMSCAAHAQMRGGGLLGARPNTTQTSEGPDGT